MIHIVQAGETLFKIAIHYNLSVTQIKEANNLNSDNIQVGQQLVIPSSNSPRTFSTTSYTVKAGDTLFGIASRFNSSVNQIKQVNGLTSNNLQLGQVLQIPSTVANKPETSSTTTTYFVQPGDTLFGIASRFKTEVNTIRQLNALSSDSLSIGQALLLPNDGATSSPPSSPSGTTTNYIVQAGDSLFAVATRFNTSVDNLMQLNQLSSSSLRVGQVLKVPSSGGSVPPPPSMPSGNISTYVVQAGDTLFKIANQFNTTVAELRTLNNLSSDSLSLGQVLKVSGTNSGAGSSSGGISGATSPSSGEEIYIVKPGDTLAVIAWIFDTKVDVIKARNGLVSDEISVGQQLIILRGSISFEGDSSLQDSDVQEDTNNETSTNTGSSSSSSTTSTGGIGAGNTGTSESGDPVYYTVEAGDTLWSIAQRFNTTVDRIITLNVLVSTGLTVGQALIVDIIGGSVGSVGDNSQTDESKISFQYHTAINSPVGEGGANFSRDVVKIQEQLLRLGFLSRDAFNVEKPFSEESRNVPASQIPNTIQAIHQFEQEVINELPTSVLMPDSTALIYLNTAVPKPSITALGDLRNARAEFKVQQNNGSAILADGLSNPVGATSTGNVISDVKKVQEILVKLGYLSQWHGEAPTGSGTVSSSRLSKTIEAIKKFQDKRVKYWKGKTALVGNLGYTKGIVQPNDLTHKLLKEFTIFGITYPSLNDPNKRESVEFKNFVKTSFTVSTDGISYWGKVKPNAISLSEYQSIGLTRTQARALQYVSEHEGNFDALNSYDKAIFSYGFIQFAGWKGGLTRMMALLKHQRPDTFRRRFQRYGVDVEYIVSGDKISKAHLAITDANNGQLLRREAAEKRLRSDKLFCGVFIKAAYDKEVQLAQITSAKKDYVEAALNILVTFSVEVAGKTISYSKHPITDIIRSEMGMTVLIDLTVNQWIVTTGDLFVTAIKKVALIDRLDSKAKIRNINELKVLKEVSKIGDSRVRSRTSDIINNSGLSTRK